MARWRPLLPGPVIEAPDRHAAELVACQRHGQEVLHVISQLELEEMRAERQAGNRRRKLLEDDT